MSSPARRSRNQAKPPATGGSASSPARPRILTSAANTVARTARSERLFPRTGGRVLVALSGGPDSLAALLVLESLRDQFGFELLAAHFDHQLRPGSHGDLEWCRQFCNDRGIPFFSGEGDVRRAAEEGGRGIEESARTMRYQFLSFVAGKERVERIATGHTANDQAETVLQRIIRGTGVRGIRGMLPLAPVPGSPGLTLIRPLLGITREQTMAICADAGITPLSDDSNADTAYTRNRLRHETLPALAMVSPSVSDALIGLAASARAVFDGVEKSAMGVQPKSRGPVGSIFAIEAVAGLLDEAVTLVIEREASFHKTPIDLNRTRVMNLRRVLSSGHGAVHFGETMVEASSRLLRIGPRLASPLSVDATVLNVPGSTKAGPWRIDAFTSAREAPPDSWSGAISLAAQSGVLRIRDATPGDMVRTGTHHRKLSDWLAGRRIPAWDRAGLAVVADSKQVHAIVGLPLPSQEPPDEDALYLRAIRL